MNRILKKKYENKKQDAFTRGIQFSLTIEQYRSLKECQTVCDYTGEVFKGTDFFQATIERIDADQGYSEDNCCVVTARANNLKDAIEKGRNSSMNIDEVELVNKIKHTLENKTPEQLTEKYREATERRRVEAEQEQVATRKGEVERRQQEKKDNSIRDAAFMKGITYEEEEKRRELQSLNDRTLNSLVVVEEATVPVKEFMLNELDIANAYISFVKEKEKDGGCGISFSTFKRLFLRSTCQVTNKVFDDKEGFPLSKIYAKKDETLGWVNGNVYSVCMLVQWTLGEGSFDKNQQKKLARYILKNR